MDKYNVVREVFCYYYGLNNENLSCIKMCKENKYLFLLLLREFNCFNIERLKYDLDINSSRAISSNLKKAEEKLLINKEFRCGYFELEEKIQEKI